MYVKVCAEERVAGIEVSGTPMDRGVSMEAIAFFKAKQWEEVNELLLDIVFQPDIKTWKGRTYIGLYIHS